MHQYRSPDALVQIAGCASTDRRMRNFRAGNAAGSATVVVEKMKNIGIISESNLIDDENFIFY